MLLYPKSAVVIANTVLMAAGSIEVIQPAARVNPVYLGYQACFAGATQWFFHNRRAL